MIKAGVFGATGRVGRLVTEHLEKSKTVHLESVYVRRELDFSLPPSTLVTNDFSTFLGSVEVVVDFSLPDALEKLLQTALEGKPRPIVIGTTGLSKHQFNLMEEASTKMPILYATNMSLGIALLNRIVDMAARSLQGFDIEVVEMHHRHKKDAPSGTALTLAETAAGARGLDLDSIRVSGRNGNIGERSADEIAVMSLRGGDIVGRHTVGFYADGEFVELGHTATSRDTFALGAIRAAEWLVQQPAGMYSISDCLGI